MPPHRRRLHHVPPDWVKSGAIYFITICTTPRGKNQLCQPEMGTPLLDSAAFYHRAQRWWLKLFLLMPDYLHALITFPKEESILTVVRMCKSYQTKQHGISWQEGFFDHRLRQGEWENRKTEYIHQNPVRAGLVTRPEDWPYILIDGERSARPEDSPYREP